MGDMLRGQMLALRRQFLKPLCVVTALELIFALLLAQHWKANAGELLHLPRRHHYFVDGYHRSALGGDVDGLDLQDSDAGDRPNRWPHSLCALGRVRHYSGLSSRLLLDGPDTLATGRRV